MTETTLDYRGAFDALSAPYAILDTNYRFLDVNDYYCETVFKSREELLGFGLFELFPETPELERHISAGFDRALSGTNTQIKEFRYSIPDPSAGPDGIAEIWWTIHCTPIRNDAGQVYAFGLRAENVTELVRSRQLNEAISSELQHRVGNLFAMIMTIARRTAADHEKVDNFLPGFLDRIHALARTHAQLTKNDWNGMTIAQLLERQFETFQDKSHSQITLTGPTLRLTAGDAQALSMAVHELATNASKYGGLSDHDGHVTVTWSLRDDVGFTLDWFETGLTNVVAPTHAGFGSILLSKILPRQLDATVEREFTPTSHRFTLHVPTLKTAMQRVA